MTLKVSKEFMENLDEEWIEDMLLYSFNYCYGRMSYAVSVCIDFLTPLIPHMGYRALEYMSKQIERRELRPMEFPEDWMKFKKLLDEEMKRRGSNYEY